MLDAVLGFLGAERANDSREKIAAEANAFAAQQYATRYQTTVKDLTAAGLNPMLAYSQGAGSAPSGQQAQGIENSVASAVDAHQKGAQRDLLRKQLEQVDADIVLKNAQAAQAESQAKLNSATASKAEMEEGLSGARKINELIDTVRRGETQSTGIRTQQELGKYYFSQVQVNKATLPRIASEIVLNGANAGLAKARIAEAVANGVIANADVQRALNDARYERATGGVIRQTTRDVGAIAGARNQAAQADRASIPSRRR